jgi:hypothetical protein
MICPQYYHIIVWALELGLYAYWGLMKYMYP